MSNNNNQYTLPVNIRSEIISNAQEYTKDYIYNNDWVDTAHCSYIEGATAYAIKLAECDKANSALEEKNRGLVEENERLKHINQEQADLYWKAVAENDKLKTKAKQWRPLFEKVLSEDKRYGRLLIETILDIKKFLYGQ